jgi:hypothetical protein
MKFSCSRTRLALAIMSMAWSSASFSQITTLPWQPTSASWSCSERVTGERFCTLVARGPLAQSPITSPTQATATYRVLKSSPISPDIALLSGNANMVCQTTSNEVFCLAENEVRLDPGVVPTFTTDPLATQFRVSSDTPTRVFDWNGDGQITSTAEGLLLARYLLGFRGDALTQDVIFSNGKSPTTVSGAIAMGLVNDWFKFNASAGTPTAAREGLAFVRCIYGLTDASFVNGIYPVTGAAEADAQCNRLFAIAR